MNGKRINEMIIGIDNRGGGVKKSELIKCLTEKVSYLDRARATQVVDSFFDEIARSLADGSRVELRGFGAFFTRQHAARLGRNPRTGDTVKVGEKLVPVFRMGQSLQSVLVEPDAVESEGRSAAV